jgi:arylsulfatase A
MNIKHNFSRTTNTLKSMLAAAALTPAISLFALAADTKPNIIYILADDLGYGEVGVYGQKLINTPNIDNLAVEGLRFTQHYSGSTVCAPTRSTILEGKHTGYSTVRGNATSGEGREQGNYPLTAGTRTIGHMLQEKGYVTGIFGKWGLGSKTSTGLPAKQGFDYFSGYLDHKHAHNYYPDYIYRYGKEVELDNNVKVHNLGKNRPLDYKAYVGKQYVPDLMLEDALAFINEQKNNPFFLYYPLTIPHVALQATEASLKEYVGKFEEVPYVGKGYTPHQYPRAAHAAMVTHMDKHVGKIVAELKRLHLDENTIVMFSSDNGPSIKGGYDHKFFKASGGLRGHKRDLYEGGIRAPFIVKWPGKVKQNTVTDHITAQWDLMATFADITKNKANADSNGVSFLPTLLGQPEQQLQHSYLYWEFWEKKGAQAVRMGDWKGVRLNIKKNSNAPIELYNLAEDPREKNNIAKQHPKIVAQIELAMQDRATSPNSSWNFKNRKK